MNFQTKLKSFKNTINSQNFKKTSGSRLLTHAIINKINLPSETRNLLIENSNYIKKFEEGNTILMLSLIYKPNYSQENWHILLQKSNRLTSNDSFQLTPYDSPGKQHIPHQRKLESPY
jgi:hypothetical protein